MSTPSYRWHADPGHGWLEVPASDLTRYSFQPSVYSYYSTSNPELPVAYLEEDCDAPGFLIAAGVTPETAQTFPEMYSHGDSFIRRLPRFNA